MHKELIEQLSYFKPVSIPRYIARNIQDCALQHLNLKDMGQLRDRMEGQLYYDKLKNDILAEFAFEGFLGLNKFDWDKRKLKGYKRKYYVIDDCKLNLIVFSSISFPVVNLNHTGLCIFVYINSDSKVYISGLANKSKLTSETNLNVNERTEIRNFQNLSPFANINELKSLIKFVP